MNYKVAALLVLIGVSACGTVSPRHDYPSEYPVAQSSGACPDLNGTFENAGARLNRSRTASAPIDPVSLSALILAPELIPAGAQVATLQIRGPAQDLLEVQARSVDGIVAHVSLPGANENGFAHTKAFASFLCYEGMGKSEPSPGTANVMIYNDPATATTGSSSYEVVVRIYRAKDGSLVVAREHIYQDFGGADVTRQWFRFQQVPATHMPVVQ